MKNLPVHIKIAIGAIIVIALYSTVRALVTPVISLYNQNVELKLEYNKVSQEQVSNYDGYYQTFIDKQANANINKETFVQVTDIIMSNRADGQNVAWKWMQENQQIPFNEFTDFYRELSSFISQRYEDNMRIERNKQSIVEKQNLLLSKYPNNLINRVLKLDKLNYKAGYISNSTKSKFK